MRALDNPIKKAPVAYWCRRCIHAYVGDTSFCLQCLYESMIFERQLVTKPKYWEMK
jgi:hypothetical protein